MKRSCDSTTLPARRRRRAIRAFALLALLGSCGIAAAHQFVAHAIADGGIADVARHDAMFSAGFEGSH
jgi:hypothetical protein